MQNTSHYNTRKRAQQNRSAKRKRRETYNSLFNKILKLKDEIEVYPGHDYGEQTLNKHSTIGNERKTNYTLKKRTLEEFIKFMKYTRMGVLSTSVSQ